MFDSIMGGEFSKFPDQWNTYWSSGGLNIPLTVDQQSAWSSADALINKINGTGATINVDGNTMPLGDSVMTVMDAIALDHAVVTIDGNVMPTEQALILIKDRINAAVGQVTINGSTVPAGDALLRILSNINAASGTLTINGNQTPVSESLAAIKAAIDAGQGTVTINGNSYPAEEARRLIEEAVNMTTPTITINGQGVPAADALRQIEEKINAGGGIVTIDGQDLPADKALQLVKARIDNTTGRLTIDGDPKPANQQTDAAAAHANRQRPSMTVDANTQPARSVIDDLRDWASRTVSFVVNAITGNAAGAYYEAMADGGILGMASGGNLSFKGRRVRPMSSTRATIVPPNTPRLIGDRISGEEAFIPINNSERSHAILRLTAERMGLEVLSKGMSDLLPTGAALRSGGDGASLPAAVPAVPAIASTAGSSAGTVVHHHNNEIVLNVRGILDFRSRDTATRQIVEELRACLVEIERSYS
jgi:hypothetical protein